MGIVIYYKSRPKLGSVPDPLDLLEYSESHSKLFMPYPAPKELSGTHSDYPQDLANPRFKIQEKSAKQVNGVTNLIDRVDHCDPEGGRWSIIPRLGKGVCWIAPINGSYTIWPGTSPWLVALRKEHPELGYMELADLAQGWETGPWKSVPFSYFPRWFGKQLLSQTSYGSIHPLGRYPNHHTFALPEEIVASTYGSGHTSHLPLLTPNGKAPETATILAGLVERLSPTLFELLCVELLQLHAATRAYSWMHVAGAGDGGADGIGFCNMTGQPKLVLQAKWQISPSTILPDGATHLTYLVGKPPTMTPSNTIVTWGPAEIANEVSLHWSGLSDYFRRSLS